MAVNYTEDTVARITEMYDGGNGADLEAIAADVGKTVNSVRAKLVREGLYVAPKKTAGVKANRVTKADFISRINACTSDNFDADCLIGAKRESLAALADELES